MKGSQKVKAKQQLRALAKQKRGVFVPSSLPSFVRSFAPSLLRSFVPSFVPLFVRSFLRSLHCFVRSFVCSFVRSFVCSLVRSNQRTTNDQFPTVGRSVGRSLIHSLPLPLTQRFFKVPYSSTSSLQRFFEVPYLLKSFKVPQRRSNGSSKFQYNGSS